MLTDVSRNFDSAFTGRAGALLGPSNWSSVFGTPKHEAQVRILAFRFFLLGFCPKASLG